MGSKAEKTVRVIRVAVVGCDGDFAAEKKRLADVAGSIQHVINDYAAHWLRLHYAAGNHAIVRKWMEADIAWIKTPKKERKGKRVPCPVKPCSNEMSREIYAALRLDHFSLGARPLTLAMQKALKTLTCSAATKSAYPRWMIILSGRGEFPQSSRSMPIPFDKANSRLIIPKDKGDSWQFEVKLEQKPGDAKGLRPIRWTLKTGGFRLARIRNELWKLATGEWKFCGSYFVQRDGLWYVHVCYQKPREKLAPLDKTKVAFLSAGKYLPVLFRINGRTNWWMRRGNDVRHVRRQLTKQRFGKSESYRNASSARKGHGRGVACAWQEKLIRRWRDLVKTWNGQLAAEVAKRMRASGVGRLVVYQPAGAWGDGRFLAMAGKVPTRRDPTGWDWYQMKSQLQRVCQENGIDVVVRKVGERDFSAKKRPQSKRSKRVATKRVKAASN